MANLHQYAKEVLGRDYKPAFAQNRLGYHCSDIFRGNDALEGVFKMAGTEEIAGGIGQGIRAAVTIGVGNAVDIAGKWSSQTFAR